MHTAGDDIRAPVFSLTPTQAHSTNFRFCKTTSAEEPPTHPAHGDISLVTSARYPQWSDKKFCLPHTAINCSPSRHTTIVFRLLEHWLP
ncbi:hypothetical protein EVAR_81918_1 [Eumeta japonica]|uniref:Uncharacterized protein n=1 Tax=Eumeta variegata TaxID=151549 RepID=A0A4C1UX39_EUMVA|nr:hypothetical protein EVAR_81918_1 [Eumeta japonica]